MRKTTLTEKDYNLFYKSLIFGNVVDAVETSIKSSYRDVCRTITGFSRNNRHNKILKNAQNLLQEEIKALNKKTMRNQAEFDQWHRTCCEKLIQVFEDQIFYYGQAQKWINMSLKNLSILDHKLVENNYEFFHVPIDNYIMDITNMKTTTSWSRIASYDEYLNYQQRFREKYEGIALDNEFTLWLRATRNIESDKCETR